MLRRTTPLASGFSPVALVFFASVASLAVACGGSDDAAAGDESNATSGIAPAAIGEYKMRVDGIGATLKIKTVAPFRFDLTVVREGSSGAHGDLKDALASVSDGRATFAPDPDCSIVIRPRADGVEVRQNGSCASEGFGAFVDGTGLYTKAGASEGASAAIAGKFTSKEDNGIAAHFTVKSAVKEELVFDLTAVASGPSGRHGEIKNGKAKLDGDQATFTAGDDCTIRFAFAAGRSAADLVQDGPCADSAGFGAFIDVTGHYEK